MTDKIKLVLDDCLQTLTDKKLLAVIIALEKDQPTFRLGANAPNEAIGLILGWAFGHLQKTLDGDELKKFNLAYSAGLAETIKS